MRHFRKIKDFAMIGGFSAMVVFALQGCEDSTNKQASLQQNVKKGAFVVLEEQNP